MAFSMIIFTKNVNRRVHDEHQDIMCGECVSTWSTDMWSWCLLTHASSQLTETYTARVTNLYFTLAFL